MNDYTKNKPQYPLSKLTIGECLRLPSGIVREIYEPTIFCGGVYGGHAKARAKERGQNTWNRKKDLAETALILSTAFVAAIAAVNFFHNPSSLPSPNPMVAIDNFFSADSLHSLFANTAEATVGAIVGANIGGFSVGAYYDLKGAVKSIKAQGLKASFEKAEKTMAQRIKTKAKSLLGTEIEDLNPMRMMEKRIYGVLGKNPVYAPK